MPVSISTEQGFLAACISLSTWLSFKALSPPNPSTRPAPSGGDLFRSINLTHPYATYVIFGPFLCFEIYLACLAALYPNIPSSILRYGLANGLNPATITWDPLTTFLLLSNLFVGVPLRLIPYASLGKNFTFALSEPDQLATGGIYAWCQHPSYTGLTVVMLANMHLGLRPDGALSCMVPPEWYPFFVTTFTVIRPIALTMIFTMLGKRVRQEEQMLKQKFGAQWEEWHAKTARFVPYIF